MTVDPSSTGGPRPLDSINLWPAILAGSASPRTEVVHQVNNSYFDEHASAIRVGDMKLIRGIAGDNRTIAWPTPSAVPVPLGQSGAVVEPGTDHVRSTVLGGAVVHHCNPYCLFNLTQDPGESDDLATDSAFNNVAAALIARLDFHGATGPPPAWIWPDLRDFGKAVSELCPQLYDAGTLQPIDL